MHGDGMIMLYKYVTALKKGYIHVSVTGKQSFEGNIELAATCIDICKKDKINRLVVDITGLSGQPGTMADYELAKLISAWETATFVSRAALVEKKEDLAAGKFFETAARNRNINIKVFADTQEAEKWIVE
jgi:hypothetical protein